MGYTARLSSRIGFFPILLAVSGLFFLLPGQCKSDEPTLGFGLSAGKVCASGFSVRWLPQKGLGWQAGGIILRNSSEAYFNLGGEMIYQLNRTDYSSLYILGGLSYNYDRWNETIYPDGFQGQITRRYDRGFAGGAGIGFGYRFRNWGPVWLSGELLLAAYHQDILPYPQVGLHYFFK